MENEKLAYTSGAFWLPRHYPIDVPKILLLKHAQRTGPINVPNLKCNERQIVPRYGNEISVLINYYETFEFDWVTASPI